MSTVFICRDFALDPALDTIAAALVQRGIEVIRGPRSIPGQKHVYPPESHAELFGPCDVLMFSSRSVGSRATMLAAPRCRAIVNPTIGLETVDLAAADQLGIVVGHGAVPENYLGIAEAAVMLMLALRYGLHASEAVLRGTRPAPGFRAEAVHARMLRGCTVGIVGLGRIGRAVAERLQPFGVDVIACSPTTQPQDVPAGVRLVELDTLLEQSDIVGLFASVNAGNRHMIDERALGRMKPDAYLVNVARGALVDEEALDRALRSGRLAGAALDTFEVEPLPQDSPLRELDNVILTPHMVGVTRESIEAVVPTALENITRVLSGALPLYCKNPYILPRWRERLAQLAPQAS